jgi:hypothetical protein
VVPELSRPQPRSSIEAVTSLRSARLASRPGTTWSYHNPNYQVAARLVEVVSGEPFDRYLGGHILQPAGMASSTSTTTDHQTVPGLTEGHVMAYGHAIPATGMGTFSVGEGGVVSSAADMARWLIVNANDGRAADGTRIVSGQGLRVLHTPSAPQVGYALGWATHGPTGAPTRLDHSGSLLTFTSEEALWPASATGWCCYSTPARRCCSTRTRSCTASSTSSKATARPPAAQAWPRPWTSSWRRSRWRRSPSAPWASSGQVAGLNADAAPRYGRRSVCFPPW